MICAFEKVNVMMYKLNLIRKRKKMTQLRFILCYLMIWKPLEY